MQSQTDHWYTDRHTDRQTTDTQTGWFIDRWKDHRHTDRHTDRQTENCVYVPINGYRVESQHPIFEDISWWWSCSHRYSDHLKHARNVGIKKGLLSSIAVGSIYFFIFGTYALGFYESVICANQCIFQHKKDILSIFPVVWSSFDAS